MRTLAKTSGWSLILMAIVAGFSLGFAFPKLYDVNSLDLSEQNLAQNYPLYVLMLFGIALIILLDVLVSCTLYAFFKEDSKTLSVLSLLFRLIYSLLFTIAAYQLYKTISHENVSNDLINSNYQSFQTIWSIGLIIFGFHLITIGLLMNLHKQIPKLLWYLTLIAGLSYIVVHVLKITTQPVSELSKVLENVLALPMALGELGLAIWLVVKGGKTNENKPEIFVSNKDLV
ncbi:DUF4386 domain-containing protein [Spirosoma linguale]|uniref:DUF4386 domain-containing protein n=1 Tax=Spirosoma linguale (strain ATCC 33905 / DSM 74 / LMG 10896 / Claus 1) TaxID=504472 RepID=D2QR17_SPILD|nr:hypothetical protein Slin_1824 [Spirosoma linguale DSM 74]